MRTKTCSRITAILLALLMIVPFGTLAYAAEGEGTERPFFPVAVIYDGDYIVAPEKVFYSEGDTIREALAASEHTYQGLEDGGFVTSVDGRGESFSLYYDNGEYDLDREASAVAAALVFSDKGEAGYSEDLLKLVRALATHADLPEEKRNYPPVSAAYEAAYSGLRTCDGEGASPLLAGLTSAYEQYDAWAASDAVNVSFSVTLGGGPATGAEIRALDAAGLSYTAEEGASTLSLKPGDYTYTVLKDNLAAEGHLTVSADVHDMSVDVPLPEGTWLASADFAEANSSDSPRLDMESGENDYTWTLHVPDDNSDSNSFYPHLVLGAGEGSAEAARAYEAYFFSEKGRTGKITWNSYRSSAGGIFDQGCEDSRITLEIVHKVSDSLTQKQFYHYDLSRVPVIKDLVLSEDSGYEPQLSFDRNVKEYTVTTIADHLTVKASCSYYSGGVLKGTPQEGYSILVNGEPAGDSGEVRVAVSNGSVITVRSVGPNGASDECRINVNLVSESQVTVEHSSGTEVRLISSNGSVIVPVSDDGRHAVFKAAPGTYSWDTVRNGFYHATGSFTLGSGSMTVTAADPVIETLLSDLKIKAGSSAQARVYSIKDGFAPERHEITVMVPDSTASFFIFPTAVSGASVTRGSYIDANGTVVAEETLTKSFASCIRFITFGGGNNSMTVRVARESSGITYYQEYCLDTSRVASLYSLRAGAASGGEVTLFKLEDGLETQDMTFDPDHLTYYTKISGSLEEMVLNVSISSSGTKMSDYTVSCGSESHSSASDGNSFSFRVPLDTGKDQENIDINVSLPEEGNERSVYSIKVIKLSDVRLTVDTDPADALVTLEDNVTSERIRRGEDGKFTILPGTEYTYTVTRNGYVGTSGTVDITEDSTVRVTLTKAPENSSLNRDMSAEWPRFRYDENNNGVTDHPLPFDSSKISIYWANKVGEGYGASATGCPIMAGGYLYTYASRNLIKIDPMSGKVVGSGEMAAGSSFAINSPTYAEGMVFCALSNGMVQAFNAETLESLWVYKDPLGGQPNCPISYEDGYIYTGFWVGETKKADFVCLSVTDEDPSSTDEEKLASWRVKGNGFYWAGAYVGPADHPETGKTYVVVGTDDGESGTVSAYGSLLSIDQSTGYVTDRIEDVCIGDIRSSICFDKATGRMLFTSKGGWFCSVKINADGSFDRESLRKLYLSTDGRSQQTPPSSSSTPCVFNGRAYVGASGTGAYSDYSGHSIVVIDIERNEIAYTVPTKGNPQTSGLVTTHGSSEDGSVYVYFIDNASPGILRVIKDKPGQTAPDRTVIETDRRGNEHEVAYSLFTPYGAQAQYAICSPISDEYGNIYFKNDSAYMMKLGPTVDSLEVTSLPAKLSYEAGEIFDPAGMEVTAHYSNGVTRVIPAEYLSVPKDPLTADDLEINIRLDLGEYMVTYQDKDGAPGTVCDPPMATVAIQVSGSGGALETGIVRLAGSNRYDTAIAAAEHLRKEKGIDAFSSVIIASGRDFPDALSASYLAYKKDAPILLVGKDSASIAKAAAYVKEALSADGTVYIIGGTGAVPSTMETSLDHGKAVRLAGSNRYATNLAVLEEAGVNGEDLIAASGKGFADALSASAAKRPILLVGPSLTPDQKKYLSDHSADLGDTVYIAGGTGAVSAAVENELRPYGTVKRFAGANRYDTSVLIAMEFFGGDLDTVTIASGRDFPDGLSGGPCAVFYESPMILVTKGFTDNPRAIFLNSKAYRLVVMGGTGAVSREIAETIADPAKETE